MTSIAITAFPIGNSSNWLEETLQALENLGYLKTRRGSTILAWHKRKIRKSSSGNIWYTDGFSIQRLWLDFDTTNKNKWKTAISTIPKRLYFATDNPYEPDRRPEHEIVGARGRPLSLPEKERQLVNWGRTKTSD